MASDTATLEGFCEIASDLIASWNGSQPEVEFEPRRKIHMSQFAAVYGLSAHTHKLASAALTLSRLGMHLEAQPSIRCTYEHALKSMWLAQYPDAAPALVNESMRNRRNLAKTARSAWSMAANLPEEEPISKQKPLPTTSHEEARYFEKLCMSLEPGGQQAYSLYRLMSGYCHPGAEVLEFYVSEPISVQRDPKRFDNPEHWIQILCYALVWAGRAVDMLDKKHPRRNELRKVAKKLGISPELNPKKFR